MEFLLYGALIGTTGLLLRLYTLWRERPRAYLQEVTLRAVRNPGTVTLARDLKSPEA